MVAGEKLRKSLKGMVYCLITDVSNQIIQNFNLKSKNKK